MTTKTTTTIKEAKNQAREVQNFLEKIVINVGLGRASQQPNFEEKMLKQASSDLAALSGQQPQVRRATKSIAGFKTREGQIIGIRLTLRARKMVDFFKRLITIVLPRVRDFSGIPLKGVDEGGCLNIGLKEQYVFTEINPEDSPLIFSLQITVVPKHKNRDEAIAAYRTFGMPFMK